jgi:hypothetical protein
VLSEEILIPAFVVIVTFCLILKQVWESRRPQSFAPKSNIRFSQSGGIRINDQFFRPLGKLTVDDQTLIFRNQSFIPGVSEFSLPLREIARSYLSSETGAIVVDTLYGDRIRIYLSWLPSKKPVKQLLLLDLLGGNSSAD